MDFLRRGTAKARSGNPTPIRRQGGPPRVGAYGNCVVDGFRNASVETASRRQTAKVAKPPRIWAVGGGKGGVGKTVVASSLALALARRGRACALIDADLGAANLHTVLGIEEPRHTLADFLGRQVKDLRQILAPSGFPGLSLVSGARAMHGMANPSHAQKQKLIRHARKLPMDDIVIDLSAGSSFTALDFFLAADHGILVVAPEPTSIENAYHFLQMACFRALRQAAAETSVRKAIDQVLSDPTQPEGRLPRALVHAVSQIDTEAGEELHAALSRFTPALLLNKTRRGSSLAWEMKRNCKRHLGTCLEVLGEMPWDESVRESIEQRRPVIDFRPRSPFSAEFERVVDKHLHGAPSAEDLPVAGNLTPGPLLARSRNRLGKSRPEISLDLRIRESMLRAIEEEDYDSLPQEIYLRAWVGQYARLVGVPNPDGLVARYLSRMRMKGATTNARDTR